ncbi:MAG: hypothetical protein HY901_00630 [Deltaproteobacteria bacterium]|nr:hypothetical protein [Deltaproteobacteria bacterium]
MAATTSSGNAAGRYQEIKVEGAENLLALRRGGAFWWQPDGSFLELRVVEQPPR